MKTTILSLITLLLLTSCSNGTSNAQPTLTFTEDSSINLTNPDRGFYTATFNINKSVNYNMFEEVQDDGNTLAYAKLLLENYRDTSILPASLLETIETNLQSAEKLSIKLIFRIAYGDEGSVDPSKEIIDSHLSQLKPILQEHKDIISVVQAGVLGDWGEWHSFEGEFEFGSENYKENQREIIKSLVDMFPNKYIQLRYPMAKELLFGSAENRNDISDDGKITDEIAFSDDIKAKLGFYNDCFLADEADRGTYSNDDGDEGIEFWRNYVKNDTKYSPLGGETCEDREIYTNCSHALNELEDFQWSFINESYHDDVIQRWKDEGCYNTIRENIGYKLVATELYLNENNESLDIKTKIKNKGYGAPHISYDINYILSDTNNTYTFQQNGIDKREFYPQTTNNISAVISLDNVKNGEYCLYLQIGQEYSDLKLANKNMWDDELKANLLMCKILVQN